MNDVQAVPALATMRPSLMSILEALALEYDVSLLRLKSRQRGKPLPYIRQLFCRRAYALGYSSPQIGRVLNRHHTSVLYLLGQLPRKPGGENNKQGFDLNSPNSHLRP